MRPAKLRRSTLGADAYEAVRGMLLGDDRFRQARKINVEELARELGVSRSPLWMAIARLEAEGLVEVAPRQGVFLAAFDPDRLRALYESREALEGMAARLAAARISGTEIAALEATVVQQRCAAAASDHAGYALAALAFHQSVARGAANPVIERQLEQIYARARVMCRLRSATEPHASAGHIAEHERLLAALRAHDGDLAEREARTHVRELAAGLHRLAGAASA